MCAFSLRCQPDFRDPQLDLLHYWVEALQRLRYPAFVVLRVCISEFGGRDRPNDSLVRSSGTQLGSLSANHNNSRHAYDARLD